MADLVLVMRFYYICGFSMYSLDFEISNQFNFMEVHKNDNH
jgi:hypothetical protein